MKRKNMPGCGCCGCCPTISPCTATISYANVEFEVDAESVVEDDPPAVEDHTYCHSITLQNAIFEGSPECNSGDVHIETYEFTERQTGYLFVTRFGTTYTQLSDTDWVVCRHGQLSFFDAVIRIYRSDITNFIRVDFWVAEAAGLSRYKRYSTFQIKQRTLDRSGPGRDCVLVSTYPHAFTGVCVPDSGGVGLSTFAEDNITLFDGTYTAIEDDRESCEYLTPDEFGDYPSWSFDIGIVDAPEYPIVSVTDTGTTTTLSSGIQTIGSFACPSNPNYDWPQTGFGGPISPRQSRAGFVTGTGTTVSQILTIQFHECE